MLVVVIILECDSIFLNPFKITVQERSQKQKQKKVLKLQSKKEVGIKD